jgi:hypothetical protein
MARLLTDVFLPGFLGAVALCYPHIRSATRQLASLGRAARDRYLGQKDKETESAPPSR